jgi:hypothetical protein
MKGPVGGVPITSHPREQALRLRSNEVTPARGVKPVNRPPPERARLRARPPPLGRQRTFAWLDNRRRLLIPTDCRDDIHEGFLALACCLICWRRLENSLS